MKWHVLHVKPRREKKVAEFFRNLLRIIMIDGFTYLVRLLDHVFLEGFVVLLPVPGTPIGAAQLRHYFDQPKKTAGNLFLLFFVHIFSRN